ncbi:GNAT family N-acetyltransferase [Symbioplanes lichenis]|uniref:GNAT family N-acetyltransferase n=1 Tax=Symbioplanes lichenis TaxID=1629072 RepID=UPI00273894C9|nr:GNAT family N-acetyltransferase [Actinoplanes lichenis]
MFEIRPMADDEIEATCEMHARTWQVAYAGIVPDDYLAAMDPVQMAARRREHLYPTLLALRDGVIVGNSSYKDDGELLSLYVDESEWGKGTGKALFDAVAREMTCTMRLWVLEDNVRARRFYERQGMTHDGESDFWTPHGTAVRLRELRYVKPL